MNLPDDILAKLAENGRVAASNPAFDPVPVVKLFLPGSAATWLLCWTDQRDSNLAYGLCDLGLGSPEMGPVLLSDIASVQSRLGLGVERDLYVTLDRPVSHYADLANEAGRITV